MLWETVIFRENLAYDDGYVTIWSRYPSRVDAVAGHELCCAFMRGEMSEEVAREAVRARQKHGGAA